jgi:hypothetical protein
VDAEASQRTGFLFLVLSLLAAQAIATETVHGSYQGALGVNVLGLGPGLVLFPNEPESTYSRAGLGPYGGVVFVASTAQRNVAASTQDALWGADSAVSLCLLNPGAEWICDEDDHASPRACGPTAVRNARFATDRATLFVFALHVGADLQVCGGTTGTATAVFG